MTILLFPCERQGWGGEAYFANGDSASRGVAILFKRGLDVNVSMTSIDPAGHL